MMKLAYEDFKKSIINKPNIIKDLKKNMNIIIRYKK